jgi:hypothetical protein
MRAGVFTPPPLLLQPSIVQTTPFLSYALERFVTIKDFALLSAATTAVKYLRKIKV